MPSFNDFQQQHLVNEKHPLDYAYEFSAKFSLWLPFTGNLHKDICSNLFCTAFKALGDITSNPSDLENFQMLEGYKMCLSANIEYILGKIMFAAQGTHLRTFASQDIRSPG